MSSNFIRAKKLVEKWGLDLHAETCEDGEILYLIKDTLFSSDALDDIVEWINQEFEER